MRFGRQRDQLRAGVKNGTETAARGGLAPGGLAGFGVDAVEARLVRQAVEQAVLQNRRAKARRHLGVGPKLLGRERVPLLSPVAPRWRRDRPGVNNGLAVDDGRGGVVPPMPEGLERRFPSQFAVRRVDGHDALVRLRDDELGVADGHHDRGGVSRAVAAPFPFFGAGGQIISDHHAVCRSHPVARCKGR
jgi:hypothetical protein